MINGFLGWTAAVILLLVLLLVKVVVVTGIVWVICWSFSIEFTIMYGIGTTAIILLLDTIKGK